MAEALSTATISEKWLKFDPDAIWSGEALPNADSKESDEFMVGFDQGGVAVRVVANTAISIADTESLTIELLHSATSGGSTTTVTLYSETASGGTIDFAAGAEIVEYVAGDIGPYAKLKVTTTADESSETVDAYVRYLSR